MSCLWRWCDHAYGCYAASTTSCPTIDGAACPAVGNYQTCTSNSDCQSATFQGASCIGMAATFTTTNYRCLQSCTTSADCWMSPGAAWDNTAQCNAGSCVLPCSASNPCPSGSTCGDGIRYGVAGICS
jgi:hypothetical protein